jgi:hypothetical protein
MRIAGPLPHGRGSVSHAAAFPSRARQQAVSEEAR